MDRRKTKDFWAKLLFYLNAVAWICITGILLVFHRAQPEFETLFDRFYQLTLRTQWDDQYLFYLFYLVIAGLFISLAGLVLAYFRGRRKQDHKLILVITGMISLFVLWVLIFVI